MVHLRNTYQGPTTRKAVLAVEDQYQQVVEDHTGEVTIAIQVPRATPINVQVICMDMFVKDLLIFPFQVDSMLKKEILREFNRLKDEELLVCDFIMFC